MAVPGFFAVGDLFQAFLFRSVKSGVRKPKTKRLKKQKTSGVCWQNESAFIQYGNMIIKEGEKRCRTIKKH